MTLFDLAAKISLDSSDYEKGLNEAEGKTQSFGSKLGSALGTVGTVAGAALTAATGAVTAFAGSSVSAGMDFDSAMSQVAATMGTTVDSIQELRDFAQEMGSTTAFSATQSAEALNYMALAGYDAETSMAMLPNVLNLAAAGGMELATASDMITDASSALGLSLEDTSELVDKMAMASSKSNTSVAQLGDAILTVGGTAKNLAGGTTELSTALGILADNGVKGAEGGTALRNIILSLSAPTDKAASKMQELGVAAYDNNGNLRSLNDIFTDLNGALSTMTQGEQTEVLNTLFNKVDLKSANALLANTGERFNELSGYIDEAAGSAQNMADVQLDNLQGDITLFQSALEGAQIAISDTLTPSLREFVQFGSDGISQLTAAFQEGGLSGAMDALGGILAEGIAMITEKMPEFIEAGMGLLSALGQGIMDNLPQLLDAATQIVISMAEFIIQALPDIVEAGLQLIITLAEGIAQSLPELIPTIVDVVLKIVEVLTDPDNIGTLIDAALAIILALADGLIQALPQLLEKAPEIIMNLVEAFLESIPKILEAGVELIGALIEGILSVDFGELAEGVKQKLSEAWEKAQEAWANVSEWASERWEDIKGAFATAGEWFGEKFEEAKQAAQDAWVKIGDWFGERRADIENAWTGFDTWMGDHFGEVWKAIKKPFEEVGKFFGDIVQAIKDVFSGNKTLLEVGQDIVDGIWNGISGAAEEFAKNVQNFFSGIVNGVKDFLGIHSPSTLFRDQIGKQIGLGVAEGISDTTDKAVKAADNMAKDVYKRSQDWVEKQTKYNEWTIAEQIEVWEEIQSQFIETSKQYSDAEEKLYDLRKQLREQEEKELQEHQKKVDDIWSNAVDKLDSYTDALTKERDSIYGTFSLFGKATDREYIYGGDLIDNLEDQIAQINDFYAGLDQIERRGAGAAMVAEIRAMGPTAINELNAILDMTDEQLNDYAQLFDVKSKLAARYAEWGMQSMKKSVVGEVADMLDEIGIKFDEEALLAETWGKNLGDSFMDGMLGALSLWATDSIGSGMTSGVSSEGGWNGSVYITVNAAEGMSEEEIANYVERKIINEFTRRKMVSA